jgi:hypothetical protein
MADVEVVKRTLFRPARGIGGVPAREEEADAFGGDDGRVEWLEKEKSVVEDERDDSRGVSSTVTSRSG